MKRCTKCGETKALSEFYKRVASLDGLCCRCKKCTRRYCEERSEKIKEYQRRYREEKREYKHHCYEGNRFRTAYVNSHKGTKKHGGFPVDIGGSKETTIKGIEAAFTGYCDICGIPEIKCKRRLSLEHDHDIEINNFRGWACLNCNAILGHAGDSIERLSKLIKYLERIRNGSCIPPGQHHCQQEMKRFQKTLENLYRTAKKDGCTPCFATPEELAATFTGQCHACSKIEKDNGKRLTSDHDHDIEISNFRGWLCYSCNIILGHADDFKEHLQAAITYLEKYQATLTTPTPEVPEWTSYYELLQVAS